MRVILETFRGFDYREKKYVRMHKLPMPETPKPKASKVGTNDVTEGDMDLPIYATCHRLSW
jgi:hypothetical protein